MKSTWFGDSYRKEFAKHLSAADHSLRPGEVFRVFLEVVFASFTQATRLHVGGEPCERIEADAARALARVKHREKISEALVVLVHALEEKRYDFLGTFAGELTVLDAKYGGQCFTPHELCMLIAAMTLGDVEPQAGRTLWLNEPASGGGSMIIAASDVLHGRGFFPWHYHVEAIDISWQCFAMTYIQTTLLSIPCVCILGDTIRLSRQRVERNLISMMHPPKTAAAAASPCDDPVQKLLFDA